MKFKNSNKILKFLVFKACTACMFLTYFSELLSPRWKWLQCKSQTTYDKLLYGEILYCIFHIAHKVNTDADVFEACSGGNLIFHEPVQLCLYQWAWLVSSWLIRFSVGQVVLSGLPWSTSPPILWAPSGSAVSMQSWTIKEKSCWPPTVLWESAALASSYFDQSGYKWTFTGRQPYKNSPEPSSHISLFNIPHLKRPEFWERVAGGHAFFHSGEQTKLHGYISSRHLTHDVCNHLDWLYETVPRGFIRFQNYCMFFHHCTLCFYSSIFVVSLFIWPTYPVAEINRG